MVMATPNIKNEGTGWWRYVAVAAILTIQGCAPAKLAPLEDLKAIPEVPADAAHIYFMRPASTVGGRVWPVILVDNQKRGILPSAAFTIITVLPGERTISLEDEQGTIGEWPAPVILNAKAGQRYFMKLEVISDITKGIAIVPMGVPSAPFMILPTQDRRIRSMRWVALSEIEGIKETGFLMYSRVEKSGF
jgi:hypothetical protein